MIAAPHNSRKIDYQNYRTGCQPQRRLRDRKVASDYGVTPATSWFSTMQTMAPAVDGSHASRKPGHQSYMRNNSFGGRASFLIPLAATTVRLSANASWFCSMSSRSYY